MSLNLKNIWAKIIKNKIIKNFNLKKNLISNTGAINTEF